MKIYNAIKVAVPVMMLALTATSCKQENNAADKIKDGAVAASANTAEENEQAVAAQSVQAAAATTATGEPQVVQQFNVPPQTAAGGTTAPGMNPPHGQPGHRCEIAVGAPLNSAPKAKAAPQPVAQAPQPAEFSPPAAKPADANVVTAPGMNPPHGQPGHTCSVAVGAPLPK